MEIYSVSALTEGLRGHLEHIYPFVWVKGEVSGISRPSSGHVYFTLKDADALLHCVWFRGQQRSAETFDPLTGEVFEDGPRESLALRFKNGQQVLCAGRVTVYAARGQYQLVVELAQEEGLGKLHAAFAAVKQLLNEQGFFALERKRPLPHAPKRVALITAPTGAVIHDFLRIADTRGSGAALRLYPVPVQGAGAALAIAEAIKTINKERWAEAIVLMRGGGSLEDLWAFNEVPVAEAIFASTLPVLAGIGHEVDHTIADMTADVRAATPSHAAFLLWPARADLIQRVDELENALRLTAQRWLTRQAVALDRAERILEARSPLRALRWAEDSLRRECVRLHSSGQRWVHTAQARLDALTQGLANTLERRMLRVQTQYESCDVRLKAANPLSPLQRGYALVRDTTGTLITTARQTNVGATVCVTLREGALECVVTK